MMLVLISFVICIPVFLGLFKVAMLYAKSIRVYLNTKYCDGPEGVPLIGNMFDFAGDSPEIFKTIRQSTETYTSPFRLWFGPLLYIGLYDPEHIQAVLLSSHALEKDESTYAIARPFVGEGLITARVPTWRLHRKALLPAFNLQIQKTFVSTLAKKAQDMVEEIVTVSQGGEFDVYDHMARYAMASSCESLMRVPLDTLNDEADAFRAAVDRLSDIYYLRLMNIVLRFDIIFSRTRLAKEVQELLKPAHGFVHKMVEKRRALLKERAFKEKDKDDGQGETLEQKCLLDIMLEPTKGKHQFTDQEIYDEVITMLIAGYDSSAKGLMFTMFVLANHPEIQNKIYEELYGIYGADDPKTTPVTESELPRMQYMDRVIKETLRLFPVTYSIARRLSQSINVGKNTLPKGSAVLIILYAVHRSEKYWPNPLAFEPDRFLPDSPLRCQHPYAYIPFSAGPRSCIGLKYAELTMKTALATLLRKYIIKTKRPMLPKDLELKASVTMKPQERILLYLEERV